MNAFTHRMTRVLLFGGGRAIRPVLALLRLALRLPPVRRRFLRRIAMLPPVPSTLDHTLADAAG